MENWIRPRLKVFHLGEKGDLVAEFLFPAVIVGGDFVVASIAALCLVLLFLSVFPSSLLPLILHLETLTGCVCRNQRSLVFLPLFF